MTKEAGIELKKQRDDIVNYYAIRGMKNKTLTFLEKCLDIIYNQGVIDGIKK